MKISRIFIVSLLVFTLGQKLLAQNDEMVETLVIKGGFLIDGTGSGPIPDAVIIIQDERISSVGTESSLDIPKRANVLDVQGTYILPGFMNTHVHTGYDENNLKKWAESGVTTVRDLGNFTYAPKDAFSMRNTLLDNNKNARLVAAGPLVTTVGGYGNFPVTSPADAKEKTEELILLGADIIKIAIEDRLQGRIWPLLSLDEMRKIVRTAHNNSNPVSAHISRSEHLEMAIKAGVDDVAHMVVDDLPDALVARMIKKDIYWVPTLELWQGVSRIHELDWDTRAKNNLQRFVQAGGKVALGTDYDGYIFQFESGFPMTEIQLMYEAGMTPMQIIIAGTSHAAHVCNLENELGTIEPGKIADIIILDNNPLDNLRSLLDVRMVIHNGEIIKNDTH